MDETIKEIGETKLLKRISKYVPNNQADDDTAELNLNEKKLLINTDLFVEGIHFSDITTSSNDVGWRSVAANLSDLAASGSDHILGVTVGLVTPPNTQWLWVDGVYRGISECLEKFGGVLLGGDCSQGSERILSITAIGSLNDLRLHRSSAKPGDYLAVSGPHGLSRLGLALLQKDSNLSATELPETLQKKALLAHQRPKPAIAALKALRNTKPKDLPFRAGGTDSSDGLLEAINNLCQSSQCVAVLDPERLPVAENWPSGTIWDNWCLNGGEDFELVVSLPKTWANAWIKSNPKCQIIGHIEEGEPLIIWKDTREEIKPNTCFKHFT